MTSALITIHLRFNEHGWQDDSHRITAGLSSVISDRVTCHQWVKKNCSNSIEDYALNYQPSVQSYWLKFKKKN